MWHLDVTGHLFHSGLPHKGINSLELGFQACECIQDRFYEEFPAHPMEKTYLYSTPSTMKPTQMSCAKGGLNQIPPRCTISGDIRLTPFYKVPDVKAAIEGYVKDLNDNLGSIPTTGPVSKFELESGPKGSVSIRW